MGGLGLSRHADEFALVARAFETHAGDAVVGIGDDAAVLPGGTLVATDTLLEGRHFIADADPERIGRKAIAVNLSDIAAMAGRPRFATIALTVGRGWTAVRCKRLLGGLRRTAEQFGVQVVGGDTTSWDEPLAISVTVVGEAEKPVLRSGGRPGDVLCVTGPLGDSLASGRHLTFEPRVAEAAAIAARCRITAMIDLSDGISSDARHLAVASGCGVELNAAAIPCRTTLEAALHDGEDFELLMAIDPDDAAPVLRNPPVPLFAVGRLVASRVPSVTLVTADRSVAVEPRGWSHSVASHSVE